MPRAPSLGLLLLSNVALRRNACFEPRQHPLSLYECVRYALHIGTQGMRLKQACVTCVKQSAGHLSTVA